MASDQRDVNEQGLTIARKASVLTGQHPDSVAIVLHPDTLEHLKAWAAVDDPELTRGSFLGKTIITSEDLSVGTILIAY